MLTDIITLAVCVHDIVCVCVCMCVCVCVSVCVCTCACTSNSLFHLFQHTLRVDMYEKHARVIEKHLMY